MFYPLYPFYITHTVSTLWASRREHFSGEKFLLYDYKRWDGHLMFWCYLDTAIFRYIRMLFPNQKKKHQSPAFHASGSWELHQKLPQQQTSTNESRVASRQNQNFVFMVLPLGLQTSITWCIRFSTACRKTEKIHGFSTKSVMGPPTIPSNEWENEPYNLLPSWIPASCPWNEPWLARGKRNKIFWRKLWHALPTSKWIQMVKKRCETLCMSYEKTWKHKKPCTYFIYNVYIYIYCIYSDWYNPMIPSCNISYNMCYSIMSEHWPKKHVFFLHFESPDLPNLGHNEFLQLGAHAGQIFGWSLPGCNRARWKLW